MKLFKKKPKQRTFCYCPICNFELCGSDSFLSDNKTGVLYMCERCNCKSLWNFDIAPVPILMKFQKLQKELSDYRYKLSKPKKIKDLAERSNSLPNREGVR